MERACERGQEKEREERNIWIFILCDNLDTENYKNKKKHYNFFREKKILIIFFIFMISKGFFDKNEIKTNVHNFYPKGKI